MSDTRRLVFAIIKFLKKEMSNEDLAEECAEGIEVGVQCLEAAYNILGTEASLDVPLGLQEIFQGYLTANEIQPSEATAENKMLAEILKHEGNEHMGKQNYKEAVLCYTKSIRLDSQNAVYYCNRAAASNRLGNYESAIEDCMTALKHDPAYSKAYSRLGLAYASMNKHQEAVNYYRKAVELEPENENHKSNLKSAEEALSNAPSASNPMQNVDLAMMFTNPNLLTMASQMLANPSMQTMMSNILSGNLNQEGGGNIDVLLQASQQLAQQMENENPALVEQLRRHMGSGGDGSGASQNTQP